MGNDSDSDSEDGASWKTLTTAATETTSSMIPKAAPKPKPKAEPKSKSASPAVVHWYETSAPPAKRAVFALPLPSSETVPKSDRLPTSAQKNTQEARSTRTDLTVSEKDIPNQEVPNDKTCDPELVCATFVEMHKLPITWVYGGTNYFHRLSCLSKNYHILKTDCIKGKPPLKRFDSDMPSVYWNKWFFLGEDSEYNREQLKNAYEKLEEHQFLPWVLSSDETNELFYPTQQFTRRFLDSMLLDWNAPLGGMKVSSAFDWKTRGVLSSDKPANKNTPLNKVEALLGNQATGEYDKSRALGIALRTRAPDKHCEILLKYNANPRLCMKDILNRLKFSLGKETICKEILKLPQRPNKVTSWTEAERDCFLDAIAQGNSAAMLRAAPSLLFRGNEEDLAKEIFFKIVTKLLLRPEAVTDGNLDGDNGDNGNKGDKGDHTHFRGSVAEAVGGLMWCIDFHPTPQQVVYMNVEYECLVTAIASNPGIAAQLLWMCESTNVRNRAIAIRDSPHTPVHVRSVLESYRIETILIYDRESPFKAAKDLQVPSNTPALATRDKRSVPIDRFHPKHERLGIKKPERTELVCAWPAVVAEVKEFVSLADEDFTIKFKDFYNSNKTDCEPDLSGTLISNPRAWKVTTRTGLGKLAVAGTRVFFENKMRFDSQSVDMVVGEMARIAMHMRYDAATQRQFHEKEFVLVAVFPEHIDPHQRFFLEAQGINVHVNPEMKKRRSAKRKQPEEVAADDEERMGSPSSSETVQL